MDAIATPEDPVRALRGPFKGKFPDLLRSSINLFAIENRDIIVQVKIVELRSTRANFSLQNINHQYLIDGAIFLCYRTLNRS